MNCEDIARILDEQELSALTVADSDALEAHAAVCGSCSGQLLASRQVAALRSQVPALPAALAERIRNLHEGVESKRGPTRSRRPVIIGSLCLLAAAATLSAGLPWQESGAAER